MLGKIITIIWKTETATIKSTYKVVWKIWVKFAKNSKYFLKFSNLFVCYFLIIF